MSKVNKIYRDKQKKELQMTKLMEALTDKTEDEIVMERILKKLELVDSKLEALDNILATIENRTTEYVRKSSNEFNKS